MRRLGAGNTLVTALSLSVLLVGCGAHRIRPETPAPHTATPAQGPAAVKPALKMDGLPAPETIPPNVAQTPNAVPKPEPRSRRGNPDHYTVFGKTYKVRDSAKGFTQVGYASWYGRKFQGKLTSSGEPYDMFKMTAAHKTLPIPSYVKVTNLRNHKSCVVRVNDRGPFRKNRIIDLSYSAALKLGMIHHGTTKVKLRVLSPVQPTSPTVPPNVQTASRAAPAKSAAAAPPQADPSGLFLQVGLFLNSDNAEALRARLEARGLAPLQLARSDYQGKPATRVLIGPLADEVTLQAMRQQLDAEHIPSQPVDLR